MRKNYFAIAALSLALTAGSAITSFAAGFVSTPQGVNISGVQAITAPITGSTIRITGFSLALIRLCAPDGLRRMAPGTLQPIQESFRPAL